MTDIQQAAIDIIDALFDRIAPLSALSGFERDRTREDMRVLIGVEIERFWPHFDAC